MANIDEALYEWIFIDEKLQKSPSHQEHWQKAAVDETLVSYYPVGPYIMLCVGLVAFARSLYKVVFSRCTLVSWKRSRNQTADRRDALKTSVSSASKNYEREKSSHRKSRQLQMKETSPPCTIGYTCVLTKFTSWYRSLLLKVGIGYKPSEKVQMPSRRDELDAIKACPVVRPLSKHAPSKIKRATVNGGAEKDDQMYFPNTSEKGDILRKVLPVDQSAKPGLQDLSKRDKTQGKLHKMPKKNAVKRGTDASHIVIDKFRDIFCLEATDIQDKLSFSQHVELTTNELGTDAIAGMCKQDKGGSDFVNELSKTTTAPTRKPEIKRTRKQPTCLRKSFTKVSWSPVVQKQMFIQSPPYDIGNAQWNIDPSNSRSSVTVNEAATDLMSGDFGIICSKYSAKEFVNESLIISGGEYPKDGAKPSVLGAKTITQRSCNDEARVTTPPLNLCENLSICPGSLTVKSSQKHLNMTLESGRCLVLIPSSSAKFKGTDDVVNWLGAGYPDERTQLEQALDGTVHVESTSSLAAEPRTVVHDLLRVNSVERDGFVNKDASSRLFRNKVNVAKRLSTKKINHHGKIANASGRRQKRVNVHTKLGGNKKHVDKQSLCLKSTPEKEMNAGLCKSANLELSTKAIETRDPERELKASMVCPTSSEEFIQEDHDTDFPNKTFDTQLTCRSSAPDHVKSDILAKGVLPLKPPFETDFPRKHYERKSKVHCKYPRLSHIVRNSVCNRDKTPDINEIKQRCMKYNHITGGIGHNDICKPHLGSTLVKTSNYCKTEMHDGKGETVDDQHRTVQDNGTKKGDSNLFHSEVKTRRRAKKGTRHFQYGLPLRRKKSACCQVSLDMKLIHKMLKLVKQMQPFCDQAVRTRSPNMALLNQKSMGDQTDTSDSSLNSPLLSANQESNAYSELTVLAQPTTQIIKHESANSDILQEYRDSLAMKATALEKSSMKQTHAAIEGTKLKSTAWDSVHSKSDKKDSSLDFARRKSSPLENKWTPVQVAGDETAHLHKTAVKTHTLKWEDKWSKQLFEAGQTCSESVDKLHDFPPHDLTILTDKVSIDGEFSNTGISQRIAYKTAHGEEGQGALPENFPNLAFLMTGNQLAPVCPFNKSIAYITLPQKSCDYESSQNFDSVKSTIGCTANQRKLSFDTPKNIVGRPKGSEYSYRLKNKLPMRSKIPRPVTKPKQKNSRNLVRAESGDKITNDILARHHFYSPDYPIGEQFRAPKITTQDYCGYPCTTGQGENIGAKSQEIFSQSGQTVKPITPHSPKNCSLGKHVASRKRKQISTNVHASHDKGISKTDATHGIVPGSSPKLINAGVLLNTSFPKKKNKSPEIAQPNTQTMLDKVSNVTSGDLDAQMFGRPRNRVRNENETARNTDGSTKRHICTTRKNQYQTSTKVHSPGTHENQKHATGILRRKESTNANKSEENDTEEIKNANFAKDIKCLGVYTRPNDHHQSPQRKQFIINPRKNNPTGENLSASVRVIRAGLGNNLLRQMSVSAKSPSPESRDQHPTTGSPPSYRKKTHRANDQREKHQKQIEGFFNNPRPVTNHGLFTEDHKDKKGELGAQRHGGGSQMDRKAHNEGERVDNSTQKLRSENETSSKVKLVPHNLHIKDSSHTDGKAEGKSEQVRKSDNKTKREALQEILAMVRQRGKVRERPGTNIHKMKQSREPTQSMADPHSINTNRPNMLNTENNPPTTLKDARQTFQISIHPHKSPLFSHHHSDLTSEKKSLQGDSAGVCEVPKSVSAHCINLPQDTPPESQQRNRNDRYDSRMLNHALQEISTSDKNIQFPSDFKPSQYHFKKTQPILSCTNDVEMGVVRLPGEHLVCRAENSCLVENEKINIVSPRKHIRNTGQDDGVPYQMGLQCIKSVQKCHCSFLNTENTVRPGAETPKCSNDTTNTLPHGHHGLLVQDPSRDKFFKIKSPRVLSPPRLKDLFFCKRESDTQLSGTRKHRKTISPTHSDSSINKEKGYMESAFFKQTRRDMRLLHEQKSTDSAEKFTAVDDTMRFGDASDILAKYRRLRAREEKQGGDVEQKPSYEQANSRVKNDIDRFGQKPRSTPSPTSPQIRSSPKQVDMQPDQKSLSSQYLAELVSKATNVNTKYICPTRHIRVHAALDSTSGILYHRKGNMLNHLPPNDTNVDFQNTELKPENLKAIKTHPFTKEVKPTSPPSAVRNWKQQSPLSPQRSPKTPQISGPIDISPLWGAEPNEHEDFLEVRPSQKLQQFHSAESVVASTFGKAKKKKKRGSKKKNKYHDPYFQHQAASPGGPEFPEPRQKSENIKSFLEQISTLEKDASERQGQLLEFYDVPVKLSDQRLNTLRSNLLADKYTCTRFKSTTSRTHNIDVGPSSIKTVPGRSRSLRETLRATPSTHNRLRTTISQNKEIYNLLTPNQRQLSSDKSGGTIKRVKDLKSPPNHPTNNLEPLKFKQNDAIQSPANDNMILNRGLLSETVPNVTKVLEEDPQRQKNEETGVSKTRSNDSGDTRESLLPDHLPCKIGVSSKESLNDSAQRFSLRDSLSSVEYGADTRALHSENADTTIDSASSVKFTSHIHVDKLREKYLMEMNSKPLANNVNVDVSLGSHDILHANTFNNKSFDTIHEHHSLHLTNMENKPPTVNKTSSGLQNQSLTKASKGDTTRFTSVKLYKRNLRDIAKPKRHSDTKGQISSCYGTKQHEPSGLDRPAQNLHNKRWRRGAVSTEPPKQFIPGSVTNRGPLRMSTEQRGSAPSATSDLAHTTGQESVRQPCGNVLSQKSSTCSNKLDQDLKKSIANKRQTEPSGNEVSDNMSESNVYTLKPPEQVSSSSHMKKTNNTYTILKNQSRSSMAGLRENSLWSYSWDDPVPVPQVGNPIRKENSSFHSNLQKWNSRHIKRFSKTEVPENACTSPPKKAKKLTKDTSLKVNTGIANDKEDEKVHEQVSQRAMSVYKSVKDDRTERLNVLGSFTNSSADVVISWVGNSNVPDSEPMSIPICDQNTRAAKETNLVPSSPRLQTQHATAGTTENKTLTCGKKDSPVPSETQRVDSNDPSDQKEISQASSSKRWPSETTGFDIRRRSLVRSRGKKVLDGRGQDQSWRKTKVVFKSNKQKSANVVAGQSNKKNYDKTNPRGILTRDKQIIPGRSPRLDTPQEDSKESKFPAVEEQTETPNATSNRLNHAHDVPGICEDTPSGLVRMRRRVGESRKYVTSALLYNKKKNKKTSPGKTQAPAQLQDTSDEPTLGNSNSPTRKIFDKNSNKPTFAGRPETTSDVSSGEKDLPLATGCQKPHCALNVYEQRAGEDRQEDVNGAVGGVGEYDHDPLDTQDGGQDAARSTTSAFSKVFFDWYKPSATPAINQTGIGDRETAPQHANSSRLDGLAPQFAARLAQEPSNRPDGSERNDDTTVRGAQGNRWNGPLCGHNHRPLQPWPEEWTFAANPYGQYQWPHFPAGHATGLQTDNRSLYSDLHHNNLSATSIPLMISNQQTQFEFPFSASQVPMQCETSGHLTSIHPNSMNPRASEINTRPLRAAGPTNSVTTRHRRRLAQYVTVPQNVSVSNLNSVYQSLQHNYSRVNELFHSNWILANQNNSLSSPAQITTPQTRMETSTRESRMLFNREIQSLSQTGYSQPRSTVDLPNFGYTAFPNRNASTQDMAFPSPTPRLALDGPVTALRFQFPTGANADVRQNQSVSRNQLMENRPNTVSRTLEEDGLRDLDCNLPRGLTPREITGQSWQEQFARGQNNCQHYRNG